MNIAKPLIASFVIGGLFAVVGQAFTMLWLPIIGDSPLLGFAILVSMGLVGVIMFTTGLHQKLAPLAGFGLILPFNGFCAAISDAYVGASRAVGKPAAGVMAALKLVGYVLGLGCGLILLVVLVVFFLGGM